MTLLKRESCLFQSLLPCRWNSSGPDIIRRHPRALLKGLPEWQQEEILLQVSIAKSECGGKQHQALLTLDILNSVVT